MSSCDQRSTKKFYFNTARGDRDLFPRTCATAPPKAYRHTRALAHTVCVTSMVVGGRSGGGGQGCRARGFDFSRNILKQTPKQHGLVPCLPLCSSPFRPSPFPFPSFGSGLIQFPRCLFRPSCLPAFLAALAFSGNRSMILRSFL